MSKARRHQAAEAAMASPEQRAARTAAEERRKRVAACQEGMNTLLQRYQCTLQVQGQFTQPVGGTRVEVVSISVIPLDVTA